MSGFARYIILWVMFYFIATYFGLAALIGFTVFLVLFCEIFIFGDLA